MKKILLLTTGGTIASVPGEDGLVPEAAPPALTRVIQEFSRHYEIQSRNILNLDSSNIQSEEWQLIARSVYESLPDYDGIVVTHGTDTMAYTASMLTFMLENLKKPVVLTGSQMPISLPLSDAPGNLAAAFAAVDAGLHGVSVAFNHKIILGCRAVKVRAMGIDAFASVNSPIRGEVMANGLAVYDNSPPPEGETALNSRLCNDVFLLKLIPGTNPRIFDALAQLPYRGVILEAFGAGGLHFIRRDLSEKIRALVEKGIAVVVCSQCLYDASDFSIYEVGRKILEAGAIPAGDMTTEAAVTKLMWALGQTGSLDTIREIFARNIAGEIHFS
ncbi:MAG TPA: asparaginase [Candidatus Merdivicinus intestinavium]|nr:asparaginase [Candidatus Merdivicinus intestinavium]